MLKTPILMIILSLLLVISQINLQKAVKSIEEFGLLKLDMYIKIFTTPYTFYAILFTILATILWAYVLSYEKISVVYPMISISYVFMVIYGHFFLSEILTPTKIVGFLILILGLYLIYTD